MADEDDNNTAEDENTGGDGQSDGDGEGDGQEWAPPTREQWDGVQEALRKARRDARQAKRAPKADGKPAEGDGPSEDEIATRVRGEVEQQWKPRVVNASARAAFVEAGLVLPKGKESSALARVLKLVDVAELEVGDDGTIDGLDEQIEDIKGDFPELFAPRGVRPGRVDGADRGNGSRKPLTSAEKIAAQLGVVRR